VGVHVFYFLLYTAYNKKTKSLEWGKLRRGLISLDEINKVLALAGLTLMPFFFVFATSELAVHGLYSTFRHYDTKYIPGISKWTTIIKKGKFERIRILSIALSYAAIAISVFSVFSPGQAALPLVGVALGTAHFYTMEIDFRWKLQVRPAGLLAFAAPVAALVMFISRYEY